jgi:hypothetical protein
VSFIFLNLLPNLKYLWDKSFLRGLRNASRELVLRSESCPSTTYAQSSKQRGQNRVSAYDAREQFLSAVEIFRLLKMSLETFLLRDFVYCIHFACDQNSWMFLGEALLCVRLVYLGLLVILWTICLQTSKISSDTSRWRKLVLFSGIEFRCSVLSSSTAPLAV